MLEFNKDLFYLQIAITFDLELKKVPQIIDKMYQRIFVKNETFEINNKWFPFLEIYVKHYNLFKL